MKGFLICLLSCALVACQYDDLCYTHPHGARLTVAVDWSHFDSISHPTGMSVMVFPATAGQAASTLLSNDITHVDATLEPDTYNLIAFNQSPSEYGSLDFKGMDSFETATVYAAETTSSWYSRADGEPLVQEPEWIGADASTGNTVTKEMVEATGGYADAATRESYPRQLLCKMMPENLVFTIKFNIHLKGVINYRSARASLTGLARGCRLATGERITETATQLLEEWTLTQDANNPINGTISSEIQSFGLPAGTSGQADSTDNILQVSLLLVDGKTRIDRSFTVGDLMQEAGQTAEGNMEISIDLAIDNTLPDVKPDNESGNGGGFDVNVNPWDKEEDHELDV